MYHTYICLSGLGTGEGNWVVASPLRWHSGFPRGPECFPWLEELVGCGDHYGSAHVHDYIAWSIVGLEGDNGG